MFSFSRKEARALLWLLPILALAAWLAYEIARPKSVETKTVIPREVQRIDEGYHSTDTVFVFDPNTIDYHDLMRLGFTRAEALGIVKYRERGKVFEIAEDFAACYQVSEAAFERLAPYIKIGEKFRLKKFPKRNFGSNFAENRQTVHREGERAEKLINLNTADSAKLVTINGIGAYTAGQIVRYRMRLGGFARVEQLHEVRGVTEENYARIVPQIFVDSVDIAKIDINFAGAKRLASHPYIKGAALRKLLSIRQLKGGWHNTRELTEDSIFGEREVARLRPYLIFN